MAANRVRRRAVDEIADISASDNAKSKIEKFSDRRSIRLVRGIAGIPCCTSQRSATCEPLLP